MDNEIDVKGADCRIRIDDGVSALELFIATIGIRKPATNEAAGCINNILK